MKKLLALLLFPTIALAQQDFRADTIRTIDTPNQGRVKINHHYGKIDTALSVVRFAEIYAGANAGIKIKAAIADLPSTGGTVDARGFEGAQVFTSNPFQGSTKPVTLLLGGATFVTDSTIWFGLGNSQVIVGTGARSTTIQAGASLPIDSPVVRIGKVSGTFSSYLTGVQIDATNKNYGLDIGGAQEGSGAWDFTSHNALRYAVWFHSGLGAGSTQNTGIYNFETTILSDTGTGVYIASDATGRIYIDNGTINTDGIKKQVNGILMASTTASVYVTNIHVEHASKGIHKTAAALLNVDGLEGHSSIDTLFKSESGITSYVLKTIDVNGGPLGYYDATPTAQSIAGSIVGPLTREGVASPYEWGPSVGLVISPPATTNQALSLRLGVTPTGSNSAINISNSVRNVFRIRKDGKIVWSGGFATNGGVSLDSLMGIFQHNNTDTRTWTFPNRDGDVQLIDAIGARPYDTTGIASGKYPVFNGTKWVLRDTTGPGAGGSFIWSVDGTATASDSIRFSQGSNITLTKSGNKLTIAASGGSFTYTVNGGAATSDSLRLIPGIESNPVLSGHTIKIDVDTSTANTGLATLNDVAVVEGNNLDTSKAFKWWINGSGTGRDSLRLIPGTDITMSKSAYTVTINADTTTANTGLATLNDIALVDGKDLDTNKAFLWWVAGSGAARDSIRFIQGSNISLTKSGYGLTIGVTGVAVSPLNADSIRNKWVDSTARANASFATSLFFKPDSNKYFHNIVLNMDTLLYGAAKAAAGQKKLTILANGDIGIRNDSVGAGGSFTYTVNGGAATTDSVRFIPGVETTPVLSGHTIKIDVDTTTVNTGVATRRYAKSMEDSIRSKFVDSTSRANATFKTVPTYNVTDDQYKHENVLTLDTLLYGAAKATPGKYKLLILANGTIGIRTDSLGAGGAFNWFVNGSSAIPDSIRFIPGAGTTPVRASNTLKFDLDSTWSQFFTQSEGNLKLDSVRNFKWWTSGSGMAEDSIRFEQGTDVVLTKSAFKLTIATDTSTANTGLATINDVAVVEGNNLDTAKAFKWWQDGSGTGRDSIRFSQGTDIVMTKAGFKFTIAADTTTANTGLATLNDLTVVDGANLDTAKTFIWNTDGSGNARDSIRFSPGTDVVLTKTAYKLAIAVDTTTANTGLATLNDVAQKLDSVRNFKWWQSGSGMAEDSIRFIQGANITLTKTANTLTIAGGAGTTFNWFVNGSAAIPDSIRFIPGVETTPTRASNTLKIDVDTSTANTGLATLNDLAVVDGANLDTAKTFIWNQSGSGNARDSIRFDQGTDIVMTKTAYKFNIAVDTTTANTGLATLNDVAVVEGNNLDTAKAFKWWQDGSGTGRDSIRFSQGTDIVMTKAGFKFTIAVDTTTANTGLATLNDVAVVEGNNLDTAKAFKWWTDGSGTGRDSIRFVQGTNITLTKSGYTLTIAGPAGGGEANTASNLGGAGIGVFKSKVSLDLQFKRLKNNFGSVTITDGTDSVLFKIDSLKNRRVDTLARANGSFKTSLFYSPDSDFYYHNNVLTLDTTKYGLSKFDSSATLGINSTGKVFINPGFFNTLPGQIPGSIGGWMSNANTALTPTTQATTTNSIRAWPWVCPRTFTTDSIRWEISTGAAGARLAIGVYRSSEDSSSFYPGTRMFYEDSGAVASAVKSPTIGGSGQASIANDTSYQFIAGHVYWIVYNASGTPTCRSIPLGSSLNIGWNPAMGSSSDYTCYAIARTYDNTLPTTFPTGATLTANLAGPILLMRVRRIP